MLADKEKSAFANEVLSWKAKVPGLLSRLGLVLVVIFTAGWLLTFPTLQLIRAALGGQRAIPLADRTPSGVAAFFRDYPQLLWFGFILGAALFFTFRHPQSSLSQLPSQTGDTPPARFELAGFSRTLPAWVNPLWRFAGIGVLGVILVIATILRIGDAREIGSTNLVAADYDESVYASTALLMAQGRGIYRDFFSSQPPLGFLLWSLPQRLNGSPNGGLLDFLQMRLFTSILSLVTIALVYLTGRTLGGRWGGPLAGAIAALALTLDGGVVRADQQIMLEPLVNLFSAAAFCAFVHYRPDLESGQSRLARIVLPLLAGLFIGLALSVKLAALPALAGLALTLLIWQRWKAFGFYMLGVAASFALVNLYFLIDARSEYIKQIYLFQLARPTYRMAIFGGFYSETSLTTFDYLSQQPYLAFTLLAAGFGLVAIVLRWLTGRGGEAWLPVVLVAALTTYFYTGKAGFFPHYYVQMALPLALLGGGIINFWRPAWWRGRWGGLVSALGALSLVLVLWPSINHAGDDPSKPTWSWERALGHSFENDKLAAGSVFTLDTRYSFILGRPMPTDMYNKDWIENSGYTQYLGRGMYQQSLGETFREVFFDKKYNQVEFADLRYSPAVQEDLLQTSQKADYFIAEAGSDSQMTAETMQSIKKNFITTEENSRFRVLVNGNREARYPSGLLFDGKIRLVAFDAPGEIKPGPSSNKLPLKVLWRGEDKISEDYVIFVHLLNSAGQIVAQRDTAPLQGKLDTSQWTPGELLADDQTLDLPPNLAPGRYKVELGVYRPTNGQRLKIANAPPQQKISSNQSSVILFEINLIR